LGKGGIFYNYSLYNVFIPWIRPGESSRKLAKSRTRSAAARRGAPDPAETACIRCQAQRKRAGGIGHPAAEAIKDREIADAWEHGRLEAPKRGELGYARNPSAADMPGRTRKRTDAVVFPTRTRPIRLREILQFSPVRLLGTQLGRHMRRFARLTAARSKKLANHIRMAALHTV